MSAGYFNTKMIKLKDKLYGFDENIKELNIENKINNPTSIKINERAAISIS
jgi:hypothetical protein